MIKNTIQMKTEQLNWQVQILQDVQTEIKLEVKKAFLFVTPDYITLKRKINLLILKSINELADEELKRISILSLERFADEMIEKMLIRLGVPQISILIAFSMLNNGMQFKNLINRFIIPLGREPSNLSPYTVVEKGNYDYIQKVKSALSEITDSQAKYSERVSLRNVAEMTVRYSNATKNVEDLKNKGINLVVTSVHSNCSKRCQPWQGGHYTLDGTYQYIDGIKFIPFQICTDIFYVTKAGKVYKNGHIYGYNCRHKVLPYVKGMRIPTYSPKLIEKERNIDQQMRRFEEQVRHWREKALLFKDIDKSEYLVYKTKAIDLAKQYKDYARQNGRAFYISRLKII